MPPALLPVAAAAPWLWGLDGGWGRPFVPRAAGARPLAPAPAIDVALLGCGPAVEPVHRRTLRKLQARAEVRVVAVADPDRARAAAMGRHFPGAAVLAAGADACEATRAEVALVASPLDRRAEDVLAALEHGCHVLADAPLAGRAEDAATLVRVARRAGRLLAVAAPRRFAPCFAEARRLLATRALGDGVRFVYRETDAGGLHDLGLPALEALVALFGAPEVEGYEDEGAGAGPGARCRIRLAFAGARGLLQLGRQPVAGGLHVLGSSGELKLDFRRIDRLLHRAGGGRWETVRSRHGWPADLAAPPARRLTPRHVEDCAAVQLVHVLRAVRHGGPLVGDGADSLAALRAVEQCARASVRASLSAA